MKGHGNPHAYGDNGPVGYGIGGCPPGLAKKHNGCMPPGQAKKLALAGLGDSWAGESERTGACEQVKLFHSPRV